MLHDTCKTAVSTVCHIKLIYMNSFFLFAAVMGDAHSESNEFAFDMETVLCHFQQWKYSCSHVIILTAKRTCHRGSLSTGVSTQQ